MGTSDQEEKEKRTSDIWAAEFGVRCWMMGWGGGNDWEHGLPSRAGRTGLEACRSKCRNYLRGISILALRGEILSSKVSALRCPVNHLDTFLTEVRILVYAPFGVA